MSTADDDAMPGTVAQLRVALEEAKPTRVACSVKAPKLRQRSSLSRLLASAMPIPVPGLGCRQPRIVRSSLRTSPRL